MKRTIKRVITFLCGIALFVFISKSFRYFLYDDSDSYTRLMFHQFYQSAQNVDTIFVGSSHVYRSLNPVIADEILGEYTFNMGSAAQFLDGSYAMIQEAGANNDVKKVYLELYYGVTEGPEYEDRTQNMANYVVADFMRPSIHKLLFLLKASSPEYYTDAFLTAHRNWESLFDQDYLIEVFQKKQTDEYKSYSRTEMGGDEYYIDRGYFANYQIASADPAINYKAYGSIDISGKMQEENDWYSSLEDIIRYCDRKNIELVLFVAPEPEWTVVGKGNYSQYQQRLREIAAQHDVSFYDFNLCKAEYFDANNLSLFMDDNHLNAYGAEAFTSVFCRFFHGQIAEQDLFYDTYADKLQNEEVMVYGIAGYKNGENEGWRNAYIIANRETGLEYKIIAIAEDSQEQQLLQDYSDNIYFSVPESEHGELNIFWRMDGDWKEHVMNIPY